MSTLKGLPTYKGKTFGGVAACPHCSHPVRVYVNVKRTQCLLDLVSVGYLVPPYVPLEDDDYAYGEGNIYSTETRGAAVAASVVSVTTATGVRDADRGIDAPSVVFPNERGFDDDEAPFPPKVCQMELCR